MTNIFPKLSWWQDPRYATSIPPVSYGGNSGGNPWPSEVTKLWNGCSTVRILERPLTKSEFLMCAIPPPLSTRPPTRPTAQGLPPRSMSNLLTPPGLVPRGAKTSGSHFTWNPGEVGLDPPEGPLCLATGPEGHVYSPAGCMVDTLKGQFIATEQGVRKVLVDELAKAKGLPSEWRDKNFSLPRKAVEEATSAHLWSAVADSIAEWFNPSHACDDDEASLAPTEDLTLNELESEEEEWEYECPNLEPGSEWYNERVRNLKRAVKGRPDEKELIQDGLEALRIHRGNYTAEGPKYLQLLWWEFPEEHREAVRVGSSLCFLVDPGEEIVPHAPFTEEQLVVVDQFVSELISLGVLVPADRPLR